MSGINPNSSNPSIDPADNDTLIGTLNFYFKKSMQSVNNMLPAQVVAFDRGPPMRATVQPLIQMLGTNGQRISRAQIASVPVLQLGGGNFVLSFPLTVGDTGWIKACDRDISLYLQGLQESRPNTDRMFNFADGVFIPDVLADWALDEEDEENVVLQSVDGTVKIALSLNKIKMSAPEVEIDSDVTINGTLTVNELLTFENGMEGTGDVYVNGNIEASGDITPNVPP